MPGEGINLGWNTLERTRNVVQIVKTKRRECTFSDDPWFLVLISIEI